MAEHSFQEVMKEAGRCCAFYKHNCEACSLTNVCPVRLYIDEYINVGNDTYFEGRVMDWAKEHPEPVYPTWHEYLAQNDILEVTCEAQMTSTLSFYSQARYIEKVKTLPAFYRPIPADIAVKLGLEPKERNNDKT